MDNTPAVSLKKLVRKKYKVMKFQGAYKELIGTPECAGSFIIYGDSGHGKTSFALGLMEYITSFYKCAYLPLEEGMKLSFQQAITRANLLSANAHVKLWPDFSLEELRAELSKPKAPRVIFIDSAQYVLATKQSYQVITNIEYKQFIKEFPNTLFIWISHAKKGEPKGALAEAIYYDADVCLEVKNFQAIPRKSRYGGNKPFEIKPA